jgi:hypothetical protein
MEHHFYVEKRIFLNRIVKELICRPNYIQKLVLGDQNFVTSEDFGKKNVTDMSLEYSKQAVRYTMLPAS